MSNIVSSQCHSQCKANTIVCPQSSVCCLEPLSVYLERNGVFQEIVLRFWSLHAHHVCVALEADAWNILHTFSGWNGYQEVVCLVNNNLEAIGFCPLF